MSRSTPEDEQEQNPSQPKQFMNPGTKSKAQSKFRSNALKNRLKGNKTAHQLHMEHVQHMDNVKNNPAKYGPKRRPLQ
jgi:hypothetical protein